MKSSLFIIGSFVAICGNVDAKFEISRFTQLGLPEPKEVEEMHTDAFKKLEAKYREKTPKSKTNALGDIKEIMYGYCDDDGDTKCRSQADEAITLATDALGDESLTLKYPDGMSKSLTEPLDRIFLAVASLNEDNLDGVVRDLVDLQTQLDEVEANGVNPVHHFFAKAAAGVAIESTKFWHPAHYDVAHPFYDLATRDDEQTTIEPDATNTDGGRDLQVEEIIEDLGQIIGDVVEIGTTAATSWVATVVIADVIGALATVAVVGIPFAGIAAVLGLPILIPFLGLCYIPIFLIISAILAVFPLVIGAIGLAFQTIAFSAVGFVVGVPVAVISVLLSGILSGDDEGGGGGNRTAEWEEMYYSIEP